MNDRVEYTREIKHPAGGKLEGWEHKQRGAGHVRRDSMVLAGFGAVEAEMNTPKHRHQPLGAPWLCIRPAKPSIDKERGIR